MTGNDPPIEPGPAIATFIHGAYHNKQGFHASVFLRYGDKDGAPGIYVLDQWDGQPAHERHIRFQEGGSASNRAGAFSVIQRSAR